MTTYQTMQRTTKMVKVIRDKSSTELTLKMQPRSKENKNIVSGKDQVN